MRECLLETLCLDISFSSLTGVLSNNETDTIPEALANHVFLDDCIFHTVPSPVNSFDIDASSVNS